MSSMRYLLICSILCVGLLNRTSAQFSNQSTTTNYAGGTLSGGTLETQVNTSQFGGNPTSDDFGMYLGLSAFNLQSVVINVESTLGEEPISDETDGTLLRLEALGNYDTVDVVNDSDGVFSFNPVFVGDYLVNVDADPNIYVATYFGNSFLWEEAQILQVSGDSTIQIAMVEAPMVIDPTATGNVQGTIEEDFGEDENARTLTRRRAKKRKCGLRRRRTGGRTGQNDDDFELIAYGETNDNGEFEYGFLPSGTYRFFVEYPGIPLDESSFVQFDIGESGVSDDTFVLAVFATEEGVSIELILGLTSEFFTNFKIFPNPSQDIIYISYDKILQESMAYKIVNLEGKEMLNGIVYQKNRNTLLVDISSLTAGVYLLKFDGEGKNDLIFRFIKK